MRLSCQKAFILVVALTAACHESTSPPAVLRSFVLESVDTQPVPVVIHASGGDTTTLYWASLRMYEGGTAEIAAHSRQVHATLPTREATDISHYSYRIIGDSISFDYSPPCPPYALCVAPPFGKFTSSSTATLFYYGGVGRQAAYLYRTPYALD